MYGVRKQQKWDNKESQRMGMKAGETSVLDRNEIFPLEGKS